MLLKKMKFNKTFVFTFFENKFVSKIIDGKTDLNKIKIPDNHEFIYAGNISGEFDENNKAWILFMMALPVNKNGLMQAINLEIKHDVLEIPKESYLEAAKNGVSRLDLERLFIQKVVGEYDMQDRFIVPVSMVAGQEFNNFVYLFVDLVEL